MGTHLRYTFRAYPTTPQRVRAARTFGCVRVVFNDAIAARNAHISTDCHARAVLSCNEY